MVLLIFGENPLTFLVQSKTWNLCDVFKPSAWDPLGAKRMASCCRRSFLAAWLTCFSDDVIVLSNRHVLFFRQPFDSLSGYEKTNRLLFPSHCLRKSRQLPPFSSSILPSFYSRDTDRHLAVTLKTAPNLSRGRRDARGQNGFRFLLQRTRAAKTQHLSVGTSVILLPPPTTKQITSQNLPLKGQNTERTTC